MTDHLLPPPFAHLSGWVRDWALANERDRYHKLHGSSLDTLRAFYSALLPEMDAIMTFLRSQPPDGMPPDVLNLFRLAMTFAETAHPLDLKWKDVDFPSAFTWDKLEFRTVSLAR